MCTPLARLNRGATPARVMLGVTTVLTMTTLISSTNASLPKISYVKSIDAYLAFCFFMVFASLIGECHLCRGLLSSSSISSSMDQQCSSSSIFPVQWRPPYNLSASHLCASCLQYKRFCPHRNKMTAARLFNASKRS